MAFVQIDGHRACGSAPGPHFDASSTQALYADESWPEEAKTLAAMITRLDGYMGRLLDKA